MNRSPSLKKSLLAIGVIQALSMNSSMAATVTVDNGGDAGVGCTLREAVLLISSIGQNPNTAGCVANGTLGDNDVIDFSVSSITGIDAPHIQITQDVSINPGGGPVSITGLGNDRLFNVIFSTVSMDNLTISGGSTGDSNTNVNSPEGGAGISVANADLTVTNSTISGNTALDDGGGIFIAGQSFVRLIDSTVSGNTAGDNGGGVFIADNVATLSIENSSITGNSAQGLGTNRLATGNGGGLHTTGGAKASLTGSVISGNSAGQQGGGIWSSIGSLSLSGTTVSDNTSAYRGGGISARNDQGFSIDQGSVISGNESGGNGGGIFTSNDLTITNSQVINNISRNGSIGLGGGGGGGIRARAALTLRGSTVSGNSAANFAGGISVESNVNPIVIEDSVIANNVSGGRFGGIQMHTTDAAHTFDNVQILNNRAVLRGGGVYLRGSGGSSVVTLEVNDSTISGNSSGEEGGGIAIRYFSADLELNRTIVSGNSATSGGGIHTNSSQPVTLNDSAVSNNVSTVGDGGGIYSRTGNISLNNTTMSGNSAAENGGGIRARQRNVVSITNSTLADNSAQVWGGNLSMREATFSLSNSIITGGEAPIGADIQHTHDSTQNFLGGNLIGDSGSTTAESLSFSPSITLPDSVILATSDGNQPTALGDIISPLADNGGSTLTHALPLNSPAIDAGDNTICAAQPINNLDQRGEPRPIGSACDIGAFEAFIVDVTAPTIVTTSPLDDSAQVSLATSLSAVFTEAVQANTGAITLHQTSNDSVVASFDVTTDVTFSTTTVVNDTITFSPNTALNEGTAYYVRIPSGALQDTADSPNDFTGITNSSAWNFTTVEQDLGLRGLSAILESESQTYEVSRSLVTDSELVIALSNSGPSLATVPNTVTIPANAATALFTVAGIDNSQIDPARAISVTASAGGFEQAQITVGIIDDDDDDQDSIANNQDNCPSIANQNQANLDNDSQGDACDLDDDGDGLPDSYESANGLNPRDAQDADTDADGDGFSNREEFEFGSDPQVADTDNDGNGVPDSVDARRDGIISIVPTIMLLLLSD